MARGNTIDTLPLPNCSFPPPNFTDRFISFMLTIFRHIHIHTLSALCTIHSSSIKGEVVSHGADDEKAETLKEAIMDEFGLSQPTSKEYVSIAPHKKRVMREGLFFLAMLIMFVYSGFFRRNLTHEYQLAEVVKQNLQFKQFGNRGNAHNPLLVLSAKEGRAAKAKADAEVAITTKSKAAADTVAFAAKALSDATGSAVDMAATAASKAIMDTAASKKAAAEKVAALAKAAVDIDASTSSTFQTEMLLC